MVAERSLKRQSSHPNKVEHQMKHYNADLVLPVA